MWMPTSTCATARTPITPRRQGLGSSRRWGLTWGSLGRLEFGPILFKEELVYAREVSFGATVRIETVLHGMSEDRSRWSLRHFLFQEGDEANILRVRVTVHGAWLDLRDRKLCVPPQGLTEALGGLERSEEFAPIPVRTPVTREAAAGGQT